MYTESLGLSGGISVKGACRGAKAIALFALHSQYFHPLALLQQWAGKAGTLRPCKRKVRCREALT